MLDDDELEAYLAKHPLDRPLDHTPSVGSAAHTTGNDAIDLTPDDTPLSFELYVAQVQEVFPDVSLDHLKLQWTERVSATLSRDQSLFSQDQVAQAVILQLAEKPDYPREQPKITPPKRKRSTSTDSSEDEAMDWRVERAKLQDNPEYAREMTITLLNEFPLVPSDDVKDVCRAKGFLYESLLALAQNDKQSKKALKHARKIKLSPHTPRKEVGEVLHAEFIAAQKHLSKREARRKKTQEDEDAALAEQVSAQVTGATCECQCCFSDIPISQAVHCDGSETHFFCTDCALNYAKSMTEKGQYHLTCFSTAGCGAQFSHAHKMRFLDAGMVKVLDRLEQNENMRLAEIEGLAKCPFCDYAEIYPDVSENKVFQCKASGCKKASCRLCNLPSHIPKSCTEAKAEQGVSERHFLEEAMTDALVRRCPKCQTPILKDSGCNKIVCTKCRCAICDFCGKDISKEGYNHFAERGFGRPGDGVCPTTDDTFQRNDKRVKAAQQEAMEKIRAENPGLTEDDLQIKFSEKVKADANMRPEDLAGIHIIPHHLFHQGQELEFEPFQRPGPRARIRMRRFAQAPLEPLPNPYAPIAVGPRGDGWNARRYHPFDIFGLMPEPEPDVPFVGQVPPPDAPPAYPVPGEEPMAPYRRTLQGITEARRQAQRAVEDEPPAQEAARTRADQIRQKAEAVQEGPIRRFGGALVRNKDLLGSRIQTMERRIDAHQHLPAAELEEVMTAPWDAADEATPDAAARRAREYEVERTLMQLADPATVRLPLGYEGVDAPPPTVEPPARFQGQRLTLANANAQRFDGAYARNPLDFDVFRREADPPRGPAIRNDTDGAVDHGGVVRPADVFGPTPAPLTRRYPGRHLGLGAPAEHPNFFGPAPPRLTRQFSQHSSPDDHLGVAYGGPAIRPPDIFDNLGAEAPPTTAGQPNRRRRVARPGSTLIEAAERVAGVPKRDAEKANSGGVTVKRYRPRAKEDGED